MKSSPLLAFAAVALASAGSLRAQTPGAEPSPTPKPTGKERTYSKAILEKYDTNKNGVLDPDERAKYETDRPLRRAEKLKKYDKNGDGKIDEDEKIQMRVERLREADAARKADAKDAPKQ